MNNVEFYICVGRSDDVGYSKFEFFLLPSWVYDGMQENVDCPNYSMPCISKIWEVKRTFLMK